MSLNDDEDVDIYAELNEDIIFEMLFVSIEYS